MDLSDLEAEIATLVNQMENRPEDRFELLMRLQEKLSEMRAYGMPVPDDLQRLVAELDKEFAIKKDSSSKKKARQGGGPSRSKTERSS